MRNTISHGNRGIDFSGRKCLCRDRLVAIRKNINKGAYSVSALHQYVITVYLFSVEKCTGLPSPACFATYTFFHTGKRMVSPTDQHFTWMDKLPSPLQKNTTLKIQPSAGPSSTTTRLPPVPCRDVRHHSPLFAPTASEDLFKRSSTIQQAFLFKLG